MGSLGSLVAATALVACGFDSPGARDVSPDASTATAADAASNRGDADTNVDIGGSPAVAAYRAAVLADEPILYYRLEEGVGAKQAVSAVAGSPAASILAKPTAGVVGKLGSAISFDGNTDGYLEVESDATQFSGVAPFTLEAWAFPRESDNGFRHIFTHDTEDQGDNRNEYGVYIQSSKLTFERFSGGEVSKATGPAVALNAWYHVVAVYDGKTVALWLNGERADQQPDTRQTAKKDKPLRFGSRDPNGGRFDGTIDEIAVYGRALKPDRIKAHFQAASK